jgi:opacity protein-like surface antigen
VIVDNMSVKAEYLWIDLPQMTYVFPEPAGFAGATNTARAGWNAHTFKLGVNWLLQ